MRTKVIEITPLPFAYLTTLYKKADPDLVVVSLKQLLKVQKRIDKLQKKK